MVKKEKVEVEIMTDEELIKEILSMNITSLKKMAK